MASPGLIFRPVPTSTSFHSNPFRAMGPRLVLVVVVVVVVVVILDCVMGRQQLVVVLVKSRFDGDVLLLLLDIASSEKL